MKKIKILIISSLLLFSTTFLYLMINNNCKSIVQPKGSVNDKKVIELVNKNKISLFFTNLRFFKH